jgi:AraC-like DNA-binding protein
MQFYHIEPHFRLKDYIVKMWIFKSQGKIPLDDLKLVVPNGNLKLTVSYQNGILAELNGTTFQSKEHDITLTGIINAPVILDVDQDVPTETIGVEFNPKGAYRFFDFPLQEIQNHIYSLKDVLGSSGSRLIEQMNNTPVLSRKIALLQEFLLRRLSLRNEDPIFEYCVDRITATRGKVTVKELERKTGYSSRWLNTKFSEKLGISPKSLSSVIRFSQYYQALVSGGEAAFFRKDFYDLYYDQSHFIKDFKRFTGLAPTRFEKQVNDFGRIYYGK